MNEREPIDKKDWGDGPWQSEPDHLEFEYAGLPCVLMRNMVVTGSWCGYVGVPVSHRFYKRDYSGRVGYRLLKPYRNDRARRKRVPQNRYFMRRAVYGSGQRPENIINVHGGITYSGRRVDNKPEWYFGFDCAHYMDLSPRMRATIISDFLQLDEYRKTFSDHGTYRDIEYVREQTESLAYQLAKPKWFKLK